MNNHAHTPISRFSWIIDMLPITVSAFRVCGMYWSLASLHAALIVKLQRSIGQRYGAVYQTFRVVNVVIYCAY